MREAEFKLPSGKKVKMRESTGLDQLAAKRKFIGKKDLEDMIIWEDIARCIIEIEGIKQVKGYEDILPLSNKDLIALNYAYNQFNALNTEEMTELKSFFVSGKTSGKSPKTEVTA